MHRIRGIGGSERHLLTLLPALAARGLDVPFVGLDDPVGVLDAFYEGLDQHAIPYTRLESRRDLDPALAVRLPRALRSLRPDLVHTHLVHADVYGALALGEPLVSTKHNPDPWRAGAFRFLERRLARRAARIVAISEAVRRFTVERVGLPAEKVDVVHYGLDELPSAWAENPQLALPDDGPVLLCVARLTPQKGVDTAVRALPEIRSRHGGAVLLVLGEGPERTALERLAGSLGVSEAALLPGRVGDVAALYRRADVVLHPARWEGFGLAMLEAMLAGKPVVASRVASAPEIVADGQTGILVLPDDPAALADAVCLLLDEPARADAYGRGGLERASAEFSVERMAEKTLGVYERALRSAAR